MSDLDHLDPTEAEQLLGEQQTFGLWLSFRMTVAHAVYATQGVAPAWLDGILEHSRQFDTTAPILDPTAWLRHHEGNDHYRALLEALARFRREIDEHAPHVPELREMLAAIERTES